MSKTKHTPGPWRAIGNQVFINVGVDCVSPHVIAQCKSQNADRKFPEAGANARLMSAAPELLSALKHVLEHHGYSPNGPDFPDAWAAIKKAEGYDE